MGWHPGDDPCCVFLHRVKGVGEKERKEKKSKINKKKKYATLDDGTSVENEINSGLLSCSTRYGGKGSPSRPFSEAEGI